MTDTRWRTLYPGLAKPITDWLELAKNPLLSKDERDRLLKQAYDYEDRYIPSWVKLFPECFDDRSIFYVCHMMSARTGLRLAPYDDVGGPSWWMHHSLEYEAWDGERLYNNDLRDRADVNVRGVTFFALQMPNQHARDIYGYPWVRLYSVYHHDQLPENVFERDKILFRAFFDEMDLVMDDLESAMQHRMDPYWFKSYAKTAKTWVRKPTGQMLHLPRSGEQARRLRPYEWGYAINQNGRSIKLYPEEEQ